MDKNNWDATEPFESYDSYPVNLFFSDRPSSRFEELGTIVQFPKNHMIYRAGEVPEFCYFIKHGRTIAFEYTSSGEERIYNINDEGSLLFESSVILNHALTLSFKTILPSTLIRIPRDTLFNAIITDSAVATDLLFSLSEKFVLVNEQIRESSSHGVKWKVANLLITYAHRFGVDYDGKVLINEKISQQMMANLLRVNRVTVARVIKELRDLGLIEQINGFYCIRSIDKLRKHMRFLDSSEPK